MKPLPQQRALGAAVFVPSLFLRLNISQLVRTEPQWKKQMVVTGHPPIPGVKLVTFAHPHAYEDGRRLCYLGTAEVRLVQAGRCSLRTWDFSSCVGFCCAGPTFTHWRPVSTTKLHASTIKRAQDPFGSGAIHRTSGEAQTPPLPFNSESSPPPPLRIPCL